MNNIFKYLFFILPIVAHSQLHSYKTTFVDSEENSYQEQWGITLSIPNEGNYSRSKENLQSIYYNNHSKQKFFIESLLEYNTVGKKRTYQKIDASKFSSEEKDFLKLWLSYYTENNDDYDKYLVDFKSKYKNSIDLIKLELRKELMENSKLLTRNGKKFSNIKMKNDSLLLTDINKDDYLYFSLLKIDFTVFDNDLTYNNEKEIEAFNEIWSKSKDGMNYKYIKRIIKEYKSDYAQINDWTIAKEKENQKFTNAEKIYYLLNNQTNEKLKTSIDILENKISEIFNRETDKMQKDHITALVVSHSLDNFPNLKIEKINFSEDFKKKYALNCTKETCFEMLKDLSKYFAKTLIGRNINNINYNEYKKYPLNEIKVGYVTAVNLNYQKKEKILYFENNLAINVDSKPIEFESKTSENIKYFAQNPLYFKDRDFISNGRFEEIKIYEDLKKLNTEMDNLAIKFPGSIGIKSRQILFKNYFKYLIPKNELQNFYLNYFKNAIDFYSLNQKYEFIRYVDWLFTPFVESKDRGYVFESFCKMLTKDTKDKVLDYLKLKVSENPNSKNLQEILGKL